MGHFLVAAAHETFVGEKKRKNINLNDDPQLVIIMSPFIRLSSRFAKLATAATVVGGTGSLYLYRNELKPYLFRGHHQPNVATKHTDGGELDSIEARRRTLIENLPEQIPYLLVGGGTASHSAMKAIRGHDPKAKVLIVSSEPYSPYMRPALSKELWFTEREYRKQLQFKWWNGKEKSIFYEIDEFFIPISKLAERETGGVSIINNLHVTHLNPDEKVAYLENGQTIKYDKCLLAPGGKPKTLPQLEAAPDEIKKRVVYSTLR